MRKKMNQKGYTLLEVITAVIIIAVLLLIAVPGVSRLLANFRNDYYLKLQKSTQTAGQSYILANRRLRPVEIFESRVIPIETLVNNKLIDPLIDYRKNACSDESYIIAIKTADKKYAYESCLVCPTDNYLTDIKKHPFCDPAWKTNENISIELTPPKADVYIPLNASLDYIRGELGLRKRIVKRNSQGEIIATLAVDDNEVIYPNNINSFIGTTAQSGVAVYNYKGQTLQSNVHIYQNEAPKVTAKNIRNGTNYEMGTWSSGVRVTLETNDKYFGILNLTINEYQYFNEQEGVWKKITSCSSGLSSCTFAYNETMVKSNKFRIINSGGAVSKETDYYSFKIDASTPNCNLNMIDGTGNLYTGGYINTSQISIRYSADDPQHEGLPASSMSKAELYILNLNPIDPDTTDILNANVPPWKVIRTIPEEGSYSIMLKCYDNVGNFSTASANINILRDINVNFYSPTSTSLLQTTIYQYSKPYGTLPTPSRVGHTFLGWYSTPTTGGEKIETTTVLSSTSKNYSVFSRWEPNVYELTYDSAGGTQVSNPASYIYGQGVASFNSPTRTGYTFLGWFVNDKLVTRITTTDIDNKHLIAKWSAVSYSIKYNANGGTGSMSNTSCSYNQNCATRLNSFTRRGHNFIGWARSAGGAAQYNNGATVLNLTSTPGATINFYAKWSVNSYGITYHLDGGTNAPTNPGSYTYGTALTFANPSKKGYRFDGWYSSSAFTTRVTGIGSDQIDAVNVYAKWIPNTYYIDYVANGGTGTMARTTCTYGKDCATRVNTFTRVYYRFDHWSSGGKSYTSGESVRDLTDTHEGVVQFTANWVKQLRYIYFLHSFPGESSNLYGFNTQNIKLNAGQLYYIESNGSISSTAAANNYQLHVYLYRPDWSWSQPMIINSVAPTSSWAGAYFSAPSTQEYNLTGYMYPDGGSRSGTANWTVTDLFQNSTFQQSQIHKTVDVGTNMNFWQAGAARRGYVFAGWLNTKTNVVHQAGTNTVLTEDQATQHPHVLDIVYRAQWNANGYTIAYNANGGSGSMANTDCIYDQACKLRAVTMSRTGYRFAGWATSAGGSVAYANEATVTNLAEEGTTTLYAKWSANTYTIRYNVNGGSGSMSATSCTYGSNCTLRTNAFSRTGHRFMGWATSPTGTATYSNEQTISNLTTVHGGTVDLYAVWAVNTYTIVYNINTGTSGAMSSTTCTYGVNCTLRSNAFVKTGYHFTGWATSASGGVSYGNGAAVINLSSSHGATINLYAKWASSNYSITYVLNGGTNSSSNPSTYTHGTAVTFSNPSRTGYTFGGWYSNSALTTRIYGVSASQTGAVTAYAKWTANTFHIDYAGNGNTGGSMARTTCTYGSTCTLRSNAFTKTYNRFNRWKGSNGTYYNNGVDVKNITSTNGAVITMTAQWVQQIRYIYGLLGVPAGGTSSAYGFGSYPMYFDAGAKLYIESTGYINQTAYNNGHELRIFVYPPNWAWSQSAATRNVGTNAYPGAYFTVPTTGLHRVTGYMYPSGGTRTGTVTWNGSMVYQDSTFQQNSVWKTVDNGTAHTTFHPAARPVCSVFSRWRSYYKSGTYYSANQAMTLNTTSADSSYRVYFLAEWSDYSNSSTTYGTCSKACGGGTRTKTVTRTDKSTGDTCHNGVTTTNEACNTTACCASKVVSSYGSWSACTKICGTGTQSRTVYYKSSYDGNVSCGTSTETRNCNTYGCCTSTSTTYGSWSACSKKCGTGTQTRTVTKKSTYDGSVCSTSTESQNCNTIDCCASKVVSSYGSWSACTKTCGTGTQSRTVYYKSSFDGSACGSSTQSQNCNTRTCCSATVVSHYGSWSACTKTCGTGTQSRTVYYKSSYDGSACGSNTQSQNCNTHACFSTITVYPTQSTSVLCPRTITFKGNAEWKSTVVTAHYCTSCPAFDIFNGNIANQVWYSGSAWTYSNLTYSGSRGSELWFEFTGVGLDGGSANSVKGGCY